MASKSKTVAELIEVDGDIVVAALDNVEPSFVSDKSNSSTGALGLPTGTTAQRPGSPETGYTRMNTDTGSIEFYDGTTWIATNLIPTVDSVSGTIYAGVATDLTLSLSNATDSIDVVFKEGATTLATVSDVTVTSGSATVTVPSAVYGQTAGDTIAISVNNEDGTPSSNSQTKTVLALPSGGTVTTSGNYRIHTFTSTDDFVVPSGLTLSNVEYIVVAGGGGGGGGYTSAPGDVGGGGGAGGYRSSVTGESSGRGSSPESKMTISAGTYQASIGAGGTGDANGGNSSFNSITSTGGGSGGYSNWRYANIYGGVGDNFGAYSGGAGGCGGGGASSGIAGTGTAGQGYDGGSNDGALSTAGAGGGAGSAGASNVNNSGGGSGVSSSISGSSYTYSSGGNSASAANGSNYGDGGGGSTADAANNGDGADGVVVIRYVLP